MIIFYFLVAFNIGLFKFPAGLLQASADFVNLSFFIYSIYEYRIKRKNLLHTSFSFLEKSWVIFLVYFIISTLTSPALSKYGSIGNLRLAYPFFLFFSSVALLTSQEKIDAFLKVLVFYAIIGGVISIIQSFYGIVPMFDIKGFYDIGHWGGQQAYIVPGVARVMLPPLYLIYFVFIALLFNQILFHDKKYFVLLIFFLLTILIGFARSQWTAIILAMMITMVVVRRESMFDLKRILELLILVILSAILGYFIVKNVFGESFLLALKSRFFLFFSDIQYGQGTFGSRLLTMDKSIKLWVENPFWGHGAAYISTNKMAWLSDVGITYVLVTIGIIGLVLILILYISIVLFSYRIIKLSIKVKNKKLLFAGIVSFSIPIFFFISQHFTQSTFIYVLLSLGSGYCAAQYKIYLQDEIKRKILNTMDVQ